MISSFISDSFHWAIYYSTAKFDQSINPSSRINIERERKKKEDKTTIFAIYYAFFILPLDFLDLLVFDQVQCEGSFACDSALSVVDTLEERAP